MVEIGSYIAGKFASPATRTPPARSSWARAGSPAERADLVQTLTSLGREYTARQEDQAGAWPGSNTTGSASGERNVRPEMWTSSAAGSSRRLGRRSNSAFS